MPWFRTHGRVVQNVSERIRKYRLAEADQLFATSFTAKLFATGSADTGFTDKLFATSFTAKLFDTGFADQLPGKQEGDLERIRTCRRTYGNLI